MLSSHQHLLLGQLRWVGRKRSPDAAFSVRGEPGFVLCGGTMGAGHEHSLFFSRGLTALLKLVSLFVPKEPEGRCHRSLCRAAKRGAGGACWF